MRRLGLTIAAAVLAAGLGGCGKSDANKAGEGAAATASSQPGGSAATEPAALSEDEKKALLASFPAPYNAADISNGETQFGLCRSCHTINAGGTNMTGPNLHGVFGKKAGANNPDYKYSDAIKAATFTWDLPHLDQWLADPKGFLPGTKMTFAGVKDANDRRDLVAYVAMETGYKPK
ncbi:cytochrome c family protein [Phenylobacterium sp.]|jgi:cytochrome c|uniref:c-type cytochrome n=1 Tax=Phenylobacterium sp. TaxID=1871053 RepID=UPI002F920B6F